ncbi:MAG: ankyrin repeat domain-containing protein [Rubrivivax sp.]|nr:ankyrin repeat domain-containing protein [Rubrivivax sp.]
MARALEAGFDPNTPDARGQPALVLAMREGSFEVAELLLSLPNVDVDRPNRSGETALMMAALRGHLEWIGRLLARGATVNRSGWSPLHYAASGPEPRAIVLLLERGAALDAVSSNGTTPLMMAAGYGAIDGADLLIGRGADARRRNAAGLSAADFARRAGRDALALRLESAVR